MGWRGEIRWQRTMGGPKGGTVRLGDYLVPRRVTMIGEGDAGDPDLRLEFAVGADEQARCTEVVVKAEPGGRGVRTSDVSWFHIDALTASAFETFAEPIIDESPGSMAAVKLGELGQADLWRVRREVDAAMHERGRGASDAELVEVARVYLAHPDAPLKAVEAALGYTRRTAARRAREARERGFMDSPRVPQDPPHRERTPEEVMRILGRGGPRAKEGDDRG